MTAAPRAPLVRWLGAREYLETLDEMRELTRARGGSSRDEIWLCEHSPVYTLGQAGRTEHLLDPGAIPVVRSDRGGQVTYHGPGQAVMYVLLDLGRAGLGVRRLVHTLEEAVIELLATLGVEGERRAGAPGVYVRGRKIAALGLRVRRGCSYHGVALNVGVDLAPYRGIDPCGYPELEVTRLADLGVSISTRSAAHGLARALTALLSPRAP